MVTTPGGPETVGVAEAPGEAMGHLNIETVCFIDVLKGKGYFVSYLLDT